MKTPGEAIQTRTREMSFIFDQQRSRPNQRDDKWRPPIGSANKSQLVCTCMYVRTYVSLLARHNANRPLNIYQFWQCQKLWNHKKNSINVKNICVPHICINAVRWKPHFARTRTRMKLQLDPRLISKDIRYLMLKHTPSARVVCQLHILRQLTYNITPWWPPSFDPIPHAGVRSTRCFRQCGTMLEQRDMCHVSEILFFFLVLNTSVIIAKLLFVLF